MVERSKSFVLAPAVAGTKTLMTGCPYTLPAGTRKLSKLSLQAGGDTITLLLDGIITIELDTQTGPFEYVIPMNTGFTVATGAVIGGTIIPIDIPVPGAGVLNVYATFTAALDSVRVGVFFE